jgi:Tol biopolymer transport system component
MSTQPGMTALDLFVTDLATHAVTRLTTGANLLNASIRWSTDGQSIYYSHTTGSSTSGPDNWVSQVVKANATSGAADTLESDIIGQVTSIASSGDEVLLTRKVASDTTDSATTTRALIDLPLGGTERVLVASDASYAHYLPRSNELATFVTASGTSGNVTYTYEVIDVASKIRTTIGGVSGLADVDVLTLPTGNH